MLITHMSRCLMLLIQYEAPTIENVAISISALEFMITMRDRQHRPCVLLYEVFPILDCTSTASTMLNFAAICVEIPGWNPCSFPSGFCLYSRVCHTLHGTLHRINVRAHPEHSQTPSAVTGLAPKSRALAKLKRFHPNAGVQGLQICRVENFPPHHLPSSWCSILSNNNIHSP